MLSIGTYVMKVNEGICKVEDIVQRADGNEMRDYFRLIPISNDTMNIYLPKRDEYPGIRNLITKEEAELTLNTMAEILPKKIENDKQREQIYKDALKSLDLSQLVSVLRNMDLRVEERKKIGKKITALDERYQKMMEDFLVSELAFVLEKERIDVMKLILEKISKREGERA